MASVTVDTKIFLALYTGASPLTLNTTNAPWLTKVVKIIRPSTGTGVNTRQSYNGAYNGATPGGAVTTLAPGLIYEITAGLTNSWALPDFTRVPVDPAAATSVVSQRLSFPAGATAYGFAIVIGSGEAGTYALDAANPTTGLSAISYTKTVAGSTGAVTLPVTLAVGDMLTVTATTASGTPGFLALITQ